MRVRAIGVALVCFGLAGLLGSYIGWWMMYRLGASAAAAADIEVTCTKHCGGVDGPFLLALIGSGVLTMVGLALVAAGVRTSRKPLTA